MSCSPSVVGAGDPEGDRGRLLLAERAEVEAEAVRGRVDQDLRRRGYAEQVRVVGDVVLHRGGEPGQVAGLRPVDQHRHRPDLLARRWVRRTRAAPAGCRSGRPPSPRSPSPAASGRARRTKVTSTGLETGRSNVPVSFRCSTTAGWSSGSSPGTCAGTSDGRGVDAVAEGGQGQLGDVGVERPLLLHEAGLLMVDRRQVGDLVVLHQRLRPACHELLDLRGSRPASARTSPARRGRRGGRRGRGRRPTGSSSPAPQPETTRDQREAGRLPAQRAAAPPPIPGHAAERRRTGVSRRGRLEDCPHARPPRHRPRRPRAQAAPHRLAARPRARARRPRRVRLRRPGRLPRVLPAGGRGRRRRPRQPRRRHRRLRQRRADRGQQGAGHPRRAGLERRHRRARPAAQRRQRDLGRRPDAHRRGDDPLRRAVPRHAVHRRGAPRPADRDARPTTRRPATSRRCPPSAQEPEDRTGGHA